MKAQTAIKIMFCLLAVVVLFHLCILLKIIPYGITWGGRLKNDQEMYVFESLSIAINLFLGFLLALKGALLKSFVPMKVVNGFLWFFVVLFAFNTLGNLVAESTFEKSFALLTLASAVFIAIVLKKERAN